MIIEDLSKFLVVDKPSGISTHTPDGGKTPGFAETVSRLIGFQVYVVHRLDKDTSGCLILSKNPDDTQSIHEELNQSKKKYVFISHNDSKSQLWSTSGRIEKTGTHKFSLVPGEANSHTSFLKLGSSPLGFVYEAELHQGKTHQVRIHAQESGIPILGDTTYGGKAFVRIMLHAKSIEMKDQKFTSQLPRLFSEGNSHGDLNKFLCSLDRRRFLMNWEKGTDCFRLVHREWSQNKISVEKLGEVLQILNYSQEEIPDSLARDLSRLAATRHYFVRDMMNRGAQPLEKNIKTASENLPVQWKVRENNLAFDLRYHQGLSSGLFLDQRENRKTILKSSDGKKVLNLFSYTCGFSLAAAMGGADEVVSVDTSASSLDWGKKNFELNNKNPNDYEFFVADSLFFVQSCIKRNRKFDLIILDPPTFSRSKKGQFILRKDLPTLLESCFGILNKNGKMLVTTNDETLTVLEMSRMIEKANPSPIKLTSVYPPLDFEFPGEYPAVLRGFWIDI